VGLPINLECGDGAALLFQDGAEFLHRVLWDLNLSHEYRLTAGADHVGTTLLPRLQAAFLWLGDRLPTSKVIIKCSNMFAFLNGTWRGPNVIRESATGVSALLSHPFDVLKES
jgi:hypothetical protein